MSIKIIEMVNDDKEETNIEDYPRPFYPIKSDMFKFICLLKDYLKDRFCIRYLCRMDFFKMYIYDKDEIIQCHIEIKDFEKWERRDVIFDIDKILLSEDSNKTILFLINDSFKSSLFLK